jgi:hypothetical protein
VYTEFIVTAIICSFLLKDSKEIVEIVADHYEQHFSLPEINLNNSLQVKLSKLIIKFRTLQISH